MTKSKGSRYERKLVNRFLDDDWFAMRLASSGSGTEAELPDVLAAKDGNIVVIELKFTSSSSVYVNKEKANGLRWLADHLNASPLIAARFKGDTSFYFFPPGMCQENEKSLSVSKSDTDQAMLLV